MSPQLPTSAYEYLRGRILSGKLLPYCRIVEKDVAARLHVSRTPIREALARLEMEGLVMRSPRKGAVVCPVELDEVDEIYQIRAALECLAARRACTRVTEDELEEMDTYLRQAQECLDGNDLDSISRYTVEFHALVNRASHSPRLVALLRSLDERLTVFRQNQLHYPGHMQTAMQQHFEILDALKRKDAREMMALIEKHSEEGRSTAIKVHLEEAQNRRMAAQREL
ncbi:MAG TPA: GntR family transcriptional regulator [Chloroflexota bacterium]|nr:GntR family transcriptional regulator [Chloroflexota bacterium]